MILVVVRTFSPVVRVTGVRVKRIGLGITPAELAFMAGLSVDALWEIEGGVVSPNQEQRVALMRALDAEFHELFAVSMTCPGDGAPHVPDTFTT
jgi:DNA-binding XRE family transcriptional regulator